MTFLRFKLTCYCKSAYEGTEMFLAEDDMAWLFECPKCGKQVSLENWTSDDEDEKEASSVHKEATKEGQ